MKKVLMKSGLLVTSLFIYNQAYANCTLSKGFTTVDIPITIGTIIVRPTDPIGTVLQKILLRFRQIILRQRVTVQVTKLQQHYH
ncbi:hypothetical protein F985_02953 [Acinetobacter seifertii]|uniref:Fimbrial protein n=1 Tax=Acinetobacter seifertii TaxID=1530123 RepID=N8QTP6_9GAMM|nr:hypothetical protein F985_02953 [Acinetobacter seifertii]